MIDYFSAGFASISSDSKSYDESNWQSLVCSAGSTIAHNSSDCLEQCSSLANLSGSCQRFTGLQ